MTTNEFLFLWCFLIISTFFLWKHVVNEIRDADTSSIFGEIFMSTIIGSIIGILGGIVFWALQLGNLVDQVSLGPLRTPLFISVIALWAIITLLSIALDNRFMSNLLFFANMVCVLLIAIAIVVSQGTIICVMSCMTLITFVCFVYATAKIGKTLYNN